MKTPTERIISARNSGPGASASQTRRVSILPDLRGYNSQNSSKPGVSGACAARPRLAPFIFPLVPENAGAIASRDSADDPAPLAEQASGPVILAAQLDGQFRTTLGVQRNNTLPVPDPETAQEVEAEESVQKPVLTALWDEFALLNMPHMEIEIPEEEPADESINANSL